MKTNRIVAGTLSIVLLALLGWSIFAGVGDVRTWVMLGVGVALGVLYTAFGRLPEWIVDYSGSSITDNDDLQHVPTRLLADLARRHCHGGHHVPRCSAFPLIAPVAHQGFSAKADF